MPWPITDRSPPEPLSSILIPRRCVIGTYSIQASINSSNYHLVYFFAGPAMHQFYQTIVDILPILPSFTNINCGVNLTIKRIEARGVSI